MFLKKMYFGWFFLQMAATAVWATPTPDELNEAAWNGNFPLVKEMVKDGADVNAKDHLGDRPLMSTCIKGYPDIAEFLIRSGANINARYRDNGEPAFETAIESKHPEVAIVLLKYGVDVNQKDEFGENAMSWACRKNYHEIVQMMIKAGADPLAWDGWHSTPFRDAVRGNSVETMKILIAAGADVNRFPIDKETTPLIEAVMDGNYEAVTLLVKNKASVNLKDDFGNSPVGQASSLKSSQILEYLLAQGAKPEMNNKYGYTTLMAAAERASVANSKILLNIGIDANAKTSDGNTALMDAADSGDEIPIMTHGWPNEPTRYKATPEEEEEYYQVAKLLLGHGAQVNESDNQGNTALTKAGDSGNVKIIELLLSRGADIHAKTKKGETALSLAQQEGNVEAVKVLKKHLSEN